MARKSKGNYPDNWDEIADQVKSDAKWRCVRCGHIHAPEHGYCLTVHHLDLDKGNCEWWNLVALCQRCHLQIQSKVVMERIWFLPHSAWFVPYVAGYYAHLFGMPENREWVERNAENLILMGEGFQWDQKILSEVMEVKNEK